jgi:hypothetical protein
MGKITKHELENSLQNHIDNQFASKQNKSDSNLKTKSKTVVGAINELYQSLNSGTSATTFSMRGTIDNDVVVKSSAINNMETAIMLLQDQVNDLTNQLGRAIMPTGTAIAGNVLSGKTFINATGNIIVGTMNNNGVKTFVPSTVLQTSGSGYYDNVVCAPVSNLSAENIKSGVVVGGVEGTLVPSIVTNSENSICMDFYSNSYTNPLTSAKVNSNGYSLLYETISYINGTIGLRLGVCSKDADSVGHYLSFRIICTNLSTHESYSTEINSVKTGTSTLTSVLDTPVCSAGIYKIKIYISNMNIDEDKEVGTYASMHHFGIQLSIV